MLPSNLYPALPKHFLKPTIKFAFFMNSILALEQLLSPF
jgi:hypothetical protein